MSVNHKSAWLRALSLCLLMLSAHTAFAEVYTYIDAEGNRAFTDKPGRNAKKIEIAPSNSMPSTPKKPVSTAGSKVKPGPMFRYDLLRIIAPDPDAIIRDIQGNMIITVTSDPVLQPKHTFRLLLDGKAYGELTRSPVFPMSNVDRGTHQLSVEIVDEFGRILERTPNQAVTMLRISLAQKRLAQPCKTEDYGVRPECPLKDKPPEEESSILPFL
jgi:hypothetical protein